MLVQSAYCPATVISCTDMTIAGTGQTDHANSPPRDVCPVGRTSTNVPVISGAAAVAAVFVVVAPLLWRVAKATGAQEQRNSSRFAYDRFRLQHDDQASKQVGIMSQVELYGLADLADCTIFKLS